MVVMMTVGILMMMLMMLTMFAMNYHDDGGDGWHDYGDDDHRPSHPFDFVSSCGHPHVRVLACKATQTSADIIQKTHLQMAILLDVDKTPSSLRLDPRPFRRRARCLVVVLLLLLLFLLLRLDDARGILLELDPL